MASAAAPAPARDFQFFAEIIEGFKLAGESSNGGKANDMQVTPFVSAMTLFLRIFDAFSNPFFSEVVKKDVEGNIKVRVAAELHTCFIMQPPPVREVLRTCLNNVFYRYATPVLLKFYPHVS